MTDYRIELQAFVDAAASFTEPALGHHKAWAEAVARARIALSVPESSANTVCLITPPPELVQQWVSLACEYEGNETWIDLATQAARWGSDQELEECCAWLDEHLAYENNVTNNLRAARRPKLLSLKERALKILEEEPEADDMKELIVFDTAQVEIIRRALEQLDD